ncbi:MAG TPA: CDC48 family AAA ATPase [Sandaracinaceae bacterium LLY-WYZ-13_1]|nr:CDC48 family AAA ATPase [Sandaracinaceae bacterium LLY-WYZ-13_1]
MIDRNGSTGIGEAPSTGGLELRVAEAASKDVGRGFARIDPADLAELGVSIGDVVEVSGKRTTYCRAMPAYKDDRGRRAVQVDGIVRHNAGAGIDDAVRVRAAECRPAEAITLAPANGRAPQQRDLDFIASRIDGLPVIKGDTVRAVLFGSRTADFTVERSSPAGPVLVGPGTRLSVSGRSAGRADAGEGGSSVVSYEDVGGLKPQLGRIREMIELPLRFPEVFDRLGIDPPKGVLLHGPPGCGKTLIARAIAHETEASFHVVSGPEIVQKFYGESEAHLRRIWEQAARQAPAIIFFDEIDSIAPKRDEVTGENEKRIVAQLLTLMDGLKPRQNVVVIGATNRPDALDEALRRPGRFDRELTIGVPDVEGRREVLQIHTRGMPLDDDVDVGALARATYGFVGADLAALCREAALEALRRVLPELDLEGDEIPESVLAKLSVSGADFQRGLKRVQPTALREIMIQTPDVSWDDIGGLDDPKRELREGIELPLRHPEAFGRMGIRPAKGFLLYGPPGTGKTLLAKAVAREAEANFIAMRSSDLLSKWYGESEKQVARLFSRARQVAPTVVFLDEIDSLAPRRGGSLGEPAVTERVVNTILAEMDGLEELQGVIVIGATNQPTLIDPALLRPGRFDELVYVPVPSEEGRLKILRIHTRDMPLAAGVDLNELARRTEGYTGADLEDLVRRAGLLALRHDLEVTDVPMPLFEQALTETRASVTEEMDQEYRRMAEELSREAPRRDKRIGF